jgi:hypothetical protein
VARGNLSDAPLTFSCSCGNLQGHINANAAKSGARLECYCRDCRAAELYFQQPDPAPGGVDLFQTTPDAISITQGQQYLGLFRLGPRGVMRWYATCCNAPMFNTLAKPQLAFAGLVVARLSDPTQIGPVKARANMTGPGGKLKHQGVGRIVFGIATRMLAARLSGRWRQTPFFDIETSAPVAQAIIPNKAERAALYPS